MSLGLWGDDVVNAAHLLCLGFRLHLRIIEIYDTFSVKLLHGLHKTFRELPQSIAYFLAWSIVQVSS